MYSDTCDAQEAEKRNLQAVLQTVEKVQAEGSSVQANGDADATLHGNHTLEQRALDDGAEGLDPAASGQAAATPGTLEPLATAHQYEGALLSRTASSPWLPGSSNLMTDHSLRLNARNGFPATATTHHCGSAGTLRSMPANSQVRCSRVLFVENKCKCACVRLRGERCLLTACLLLPLAIPLHLPHRDSSPL